MEKQETDKRVFYSSLFKLVLPIAVQNLISTAVNSADVIMVGAVGQDALSAVSLANQVQFILSLVYSEVASGATMLSAQYWGKNDTKTIEKIMGIAGAALATVIARGVELGICLVDAARFKTVRLRISAVFEKNKVLFQDYLKYALPAFGNEVVWHFPCIL